MAVSVWDAAIFQYVWFMYYSLCLPINIIIQIGTDFLSLQQDGVLCPLWFVFEEHGETVFE